MTLHNLRAINEATAKKLVLFLENYSLQLQNVCRDNKRTGVSQVTNTRAVSSYVYVVTARLVVQKKNSKIPIRFLLF